MAPFALVHMQISYFALLLILQKISVWVVVQVAALYNSDERSVFVGHVDSVGKRIRTVQWSVLKIELLGQSG